MKRPSPTALSMFSFVSTAITFGCVVTAAILHFFYPDNQYKVPIVKFAIVLIVVVGVGEVVFRVMRWK